MGASLGAIGQVAGIFGQVAGGFMQAQGQAQSAAFQANAMIAQQNAVAALEQGEAAKRRQERIGKARLASSAVKFLKGGVVLAGSPLAVLGDEAINEALAAEDFLFEGQIKANQERNQARLQGFFAQQAQQKAANIRSDADFRAGTTLLGSSLRMLK
jgi:hypothetical protein